MYIRAAGDNAGCKESCADGGEETCLQVVLCFSESPAGEKSEYITPAKTFGVVRFPESSRLFVSAGFGAGCV